MNGSISGESLIVSCNILEYSYLKFIFFWNFWNLVDQSNDDIEEGEISQTACTGSGGGVTPPGTPTKNHRGRVGYINVFEWGSGSCQIYSFSDIRLLRDSPRKI